MKRFTKWTVLVAVALIIVVSTAGCTSNIGNTASPSPSASPQPTRDPNFVAKNTPGYLTYGNRSAGFTIQYPPSWQVAETNSIVDFSLFVNTGTASGVVARVTLTKPIKIPESATNIMTLKNYSELMLSSFVKTRSTPDYKLLSSSNSTLAGYPALETVFTYTAYRGDPSQTLFKATLANHSAYSVAYSGLQSYYPANLETGQNMIQSFNIVS